MLDRLVVSKFVVVIDLDKTLFPTWKFIDELARELETTLDIDGEWFRWHVHDSHTPGVDGLRYYDFFAQLEALGLSGDEVEAHVLKYMSGKDYVYEDVPAFLSFLRQDVRPDNIILLTYGERRFQKLKFNCASSLKELDFVATLEPKRNYFYANLKEDRGIVIDDKVISGLPDNFSQFKLTRNKESTGLFAGSFIDLRQNWDECMSSLR